MPKRSWTTRQTLVTIAALLMVLLFAVPTPAQTVNNSIYAALLKAYVHNGRVNYRGFKSEETRLDRYLAVLAGVKPADLSRDERFAFYINLYNAWTIKLILTGYPGVTSIKDLGGFLSTPWKKKIVRSDGQVLTLDQVEHEILRPEFKDPRVHFAINCAALSCPPLASEPYRGDSLNQQLDAAATAFINRSDRNYLEDETLHVSRIFKWFSEDFGGAVVDFVLKYAKGDLLSQLQQKHDDLRVKYLSYDWSLNGK